MSDPRGKLKQPKNKQGKAPHALQAQSKMNAMKTAQVTTKPIVQKSQGRGK